MTAWSHEGYEVYTSSSGKFLYIETQNGSYAHHHANRAWANRNKGLSAAQLDRVFVDLLRNMITALGVPSAINRVPGFSWNAWVMQEGHHHLEPGQAGGPVLQIGAVLYLLKDLTPVAALHALATGDDITFERLGTRLGTGVAARADTYQPPSGKKREMDFFFPKSSLPKPMKGGGGFMGLFDRRRRR
jgi:hypothetical protein